jgi:type I restriction enzyme R subunit
MFELTKIAGNVVLISNAVNSLAACKQEKDGLETFKKDLGCFTRYYESMPQIVDYEYKDNEKPNLYGRHLRRLLREIDVETI